MKLYIASDHAGVALKAVLISYVKDHFYDRFSSIIDLGPHTHDSVDYPQYAHALCQKIDVLSGDLGILICGSGIGMSMCANRYPYIRAALCINDEYARLARQHNNANVLCLGARFIADDMAELCVKMFIDTPFEGNRHQNRIDMFNDFAYSEH